MRKISAMHSVATATNTTDGTKVARFRSISYRFSFALIGIVTLILAAFAVTAIIINIVRIDGELNEKLNNTLNLSKISLENPLWNLNHATVTGFVDSLFLDEAIVYVKVLTADEVFAAKTLDEYEGQEFDIFMQSSQFIAGVADIEHGGEDIGAIQLVVSRASVRQELFINIAGIVALTLAIFSAIALTSIVISRRHVAQPLARLQRSAALIANGDLELAIDTGRHDEIGRLAGDFNAMRESIRRLVDALRQANTRLEENNTELQRLDKLKDEFLANTSHELRTPLNGIIGLAESLADGATGALSEATKYNLTMIVASGKRLTSLVNDILDFAKLKNQSFQLQKGPVDIFSLVEVVLSLSQPLVGSKKVRLVNRTPADLPLLAADENRVQQIMHNLVGNAIKFTEAGEVTVIAAVKGDELAVTVADTGIGIAKKELGRIFESFVQADGGTARQYSGTGLGLAVTKQLVELHGGRIEVNSIPDVGSKFTFTLPLAGSTVPAMDMLAPSATTLASLLKPAAQDHPPEVQLANESAPSDQAAQFSILIVDDEPVNLQVLANHLAAQNYAVTRAQSGTEALALIDHGKRFDLIVLDVMMPRVSGYEVCRQLRETFSANELPVVLLSAKNQVTDLVAGLRAGASDYLTKPISKEELLARIQTHLNLKTLTLENVRLGAELAVTQKLQKMLLPQRKELQQIEGLEIAGVMEPADEVGGDYFDVLKSSDRTKIGIGDVTGHGLESGVVMLMTQAAVRTLMNSGETDPVHFMSILNRTMYDNLQRITAEKSLTLCLLDYAAGEVKVSGQHEDVIVVRRDGAIELIDTVELGLPIGLKREIGDSIEQTSVWLEPGDGIVLFTDGITEAENLAGEGYGLERLCDAVSRHWSEPVEAVKNAVICDVRQYIGGQQVYDDITLLVLKQK